MLDVYLHKACVGHLLQDENGDMAYRYAKTWLENPAAIPLSRSLPLREDSFSRRECRGFFAGILPEEAKREIIARNLGISSRNDFAMLEQIGGECAGAVTFMPSGRPLPLDDMRYRELSESELSKLLEELPRRPLLAGENDVRLSLAGAQDKIAVRVKDGRISIPLGNAPSTHILKPANAYFEGLVFNEAYCMALAKRVGIPAAVMETGRAGGIDYLLVKRYDRKAEAEHTIRLHQEDFCQALGISPEMKYQNEGGPSLKQCFDLLREVSSAPVVDLLYLFDAVLFNFLIGNHDAHGKNFSLLFDVDGLTGETVRLAPFYDLMSTVYYPDLTKKMAMKIGGEYESSRIAPRHFERLADEAGLAKPIVRKRLGELAEALVKNLDKTGINDSIVEPLGMLIRERCEKTMKDFVLIKK